MDGAELAEVRVLGDKDVTLVTSEAPDPFVGLAMETHEVDMLGIGVSLGELTNQVDAEVLVEEELHSAVEVRR